MVAYYFTKTLKMPFDEALSLVTEGLKKEGFGIISEIDVRATLKEKLDIDFKNYRILGACNPSFAYRALQAEDKIGLMLPCNVIVQEVSDRVIEVAAVDPVASMQAVENPKLRDIAGQVRDILKKVVDSISFS